MVNCVKFKMFSMLYCQICLRPCLKPNCTVMLKEMAPDLIVDGELQVDAAIVPGVAKLKDPNSPIQGNANILIFPNLESGNISYKLVERLSGGRALGPLLMGLVKPCSDLSRGCSWEDVVDCTAITAIRTQYEIQGENI